jgi:hypothetical protein
MEIHKPKAAHSAREFLVEIGTIVCGILIALGLEQAIEAWHWHHVVGEEREALRDEIGHLRAAMRGQFELDPCYLGRLADVKEIIRRHDANEPLGIVRPVGRPLFPPTPRPLWELAVADQSLAHMELSEKRRFTDAYNWMPVYEAITFDERAAWRQLQVLNYADKLTLQDWSTVREAFEHAAETHQIVAGSARQWLAPFDALAGESPDISVRHAPPVEAFCTPMLAPTATSSKSP